jgi:hypothetical protein
MRRVSPARLGAMTGGSPSATTEAPLTPGVPAAQPFALAAPFGCHRCVRNVRCGLSSRESRDSAHGLGDLGLRAIAELLDVHERRLSRGCDNARALDKCPTLQGA